ncbi:cohesin complex subunit SA-1/2 [Kwoniella mangroviensis CBS 8886]|nr:cohesin complex subunit SA-1/2 [Kwoniella mangroviensis CBS 8886]
MSLTPPPEDPQEEHDQPRRGGRARKQVEKFEATSASTTKKGKRKQTREDDDEDENMEDSDSDLTEEEDEEADVDPTPKKGKKRKSVGGAGSARKTKAVNGSGKKKGRKSTGGAGAGANGAGANGAGANGEDSVRNESPLFNALLSPDIALQPLIDEWVETYQQAAGDEVSEQVSIHELITLFIRCCGINLDIEQAEATDEDGITDAVERIQDESVRVAAAAYPLISRGKQFNAFRKNLDYFLYNLIESLSLTPILFQGTTEESDHINVLLSLVLNWLNCMSTSPLRPIRHTSTYMLLKINSSMCDVASSVGKDLSLKQRQKEAEIKKGGTSNAAQKRLKELEEKVKEVQKRKERLHDMFQEIFDVMFVHRVRDADPHIRSDCLRELGVWTKKYPDYYVSTSYLTYFTKGCNDPFAHARLETVKALSNLYSKESFMNNARTVTLRLVPRLIEMALRDVDLHVRVTAIHVIALIDKTGILADEDESHRDKVARLVYDQDSRIRKAVGGFIVNLWGENKENLKTEWSGARAAKKKRANKISEDDMATNLDWKSLATLLIDTSNSLDGPIESTASSSSQQPILPISITTPLTRADAAVESICSEYGLWRDWQSLVDYLLLDHSTADQDMWLLTEDEETFMLQVLIALIQREDQVSYKIDEEEEDRSKKFMQILPRLFAKHQTDVGRIGGILSVLSHINLGLYLDLRQTKAYETLWDDVTKQFLHHTDPSVLESAIKAVNHLTTNAPMATSNTTKLNELQESLFASLRDESGSDDVALLSLEEEGIAKLEAILLRILLLEKSRDITEVMEDEEGQSSGWDIICAFAQRGRLGYKEEAKMIEYAVQIVLYHMTWVFRRFTEEEAQDDDKVATLSTKRDKAVEIFQELTLGDNTNTVDTVRRQAFIAYLTLHLLFLYKGSKDHLATPAAKSCPLTIEDETQHRLGGAFLAAVEKCVSDREAHTDADKNAEGESVPEDLAFLQLTSTLVAAIRKGVLEVEHAKEPLAHAGRLGQTYDAIVKKLVDALRDEGIYNKESETVQHVAGSALQQSFNLFLDSDSQEPTAPLTLARMIGSAFTIRGNHFTVLQQLHPSDVCDFHLEALDYISRRISNYVKQEVATKNREQKSRLQIKRFSAITFFKVLIQLLSPITSPDALKIKAHLDDAISSVGVEVTVHKGWEPYRAYEKKLISIASKDPNVKVAANKKVQQAQQAEEETEREMDEEDEEEEDQENNVTPTKKGRNRSNALINGNGNGDNNRSSPLSPPPGPEFEPEQIPTTPSSKSRKRAREASPMDADDEELDLSPPAQPADESMQLELGEENIDNESDHELTLEGIGPSQNERERSASAEPSLKRRRTVVRY